MARPLDGIVVVDLTEYVAGPYGTMMLADMGAEILKVEPFEGDHWRRQQPVEGRESRYYIGVNRGKKSICLDLKQPAGRDLFLRLVEKADVVMENFTPGTMDRLGIGYEKLAARSPSSGLRALSLACGRMAFTTVLELLEWPD